MALNAGTVTTYDNAMVIREDLAEQYSMISPEEVPFQTAIGTSEASTQPHHEWTIVSLAAPDGANRVLEGEDAPGTDDATLANRVGNYTQISDKLVKVSHTSEATDAAAEDIQKLSKQMALKMRELKRDMEVMLMQNIAANPGDNGTVRVSAGLPAWLRTNAFGGSGGSDPTLSGGTSGYPNAAANAGVPTPLTEAKYNTAVQSCWENGGDVTITMVNANNKKVISETFTGTSTRYKDSSSKEVVNAIDIYDGDFGQQTIVPNRFQPSLASGNFYVALLDPEFASISFLETMQQKPLAETGHSKNRLLWCEYTLVIENEAAHGIIRDTNGAA
jgi:hypothetical protein